jgi:hypothetical protein
MYKGHRTIQIQVKKKSPRKIPGLEAGTELGIYDITSRYFM